MTTETPGRLPVLRDDGELIGFITQQDERWVPCAVFGLPLGEPDSREHAEDVLHGHGLSYLADRWEVREHGEWITVTLIEATPEQVTVSYADYGHPEMFNTRRTITTPTPEELRRA